MKNKLKLNEFINELHDTLVMPQHLRNLVVAELYTKYPKETKVLFCLYGSVSYSPLVTYKGDDITNDELIRGLIVIINDIISDTNISLKALSYKQQTIVYHILKEQMFEYPKTFLHEEKLLKMAEVVAILNKYNKSTVVYIQSHKEICKSIKVVDNEHKEFNSKLLNKPDGDIIRSLKISTSNGKFIHIFKDKKYHRLIRIPLSNKVVSPDDWVLDNNYNPIGFVFTLEDISFSRVVKKISKPMVKNGLNNILLYVSYDMYNGKPVKVGINKVKLKDGR